MQFPNKYCLNQCQAAIFVILIYKLVVWPRKPDMLRSDFSVENRANVASIATSSLGWCHITVIFTIRHKVLFVRVIIDINIYILHIESLSVFISLTYLLT